MPLYRQGQQIRDGSIKFSDDALLDWVCSGLELVDRICQMLLTELLSSRYIIADDTRLAATVGEQAKIIPGHRRAAQVTVALRPGNSTLQSAIRRGISFQHPLP